MQLFFFFVDFSLQEELINLKWDTHYCVFTEFQVYMHGKLLQDNNGADMIRHVEIKPLDPSKFLEEGLFFIAYNYIKTCSQNTQKFQNKKFPP